MKLYFLILSQKFLSRYLKNFFAFLRLARAYHIRTRHCHQTFKVQRSTYLHVK